MNRTSIAQEIVPQINLQDSAKLKGFHRAKETTNGMNRQDSDRMGENLSAIL